MKNFISSVKEIIKDYKRWKDKFDVNKINLDNFKPLLGPHHNTRHGYTILKKSVIQTFERTGADISNKTDINNFIGILIFLFTTNIIADDTRCSNNSECIILKDSKKYEDLIKEEPTDIINNQNSISIKIKEQVKKIEDYLMDPERRDFVLNNPNETIPYSLNSFTFILLEKDLSLGKRKKNC